jgi:hypothetical protein
MRRMRRGGGAHGVAATQASRLRAADEPHVYDIAGLIFSPSIGAGLPVFDPS